mgnify:CR=1 FL=1
MAGALGGEVVTTTVEGRARFGVSVEYVEQVVQDGTGRVVELADYLYYDTGTSTFKLDNREQGIVPAPAAQDSIISRPSSMSIVRSFGASGLSQVPKRSSYPGSG